MGAAADQQSFARQTGLMVDTNYIWKGDLSMFGRKKANFYDLEEARIQESMSHFDVCSEEYKALQQTLKTTIASREESKESKRRIAKSDRGGIIRHLLGGLFLGGALVTTCLFEKEGNTYTGEKRSWAESIIRGISSFRFFGG